MEIVYDGADNIRIRFDNGRELGLDEIENLDKALTLTRTSREWNRKRVVELEDALERGQRKAPEDQRLYTAAEVGDAQASEAELVAGPLRRQVAELECKVRGYDLDRHTEQRRADENKAWAERAEANGSRLSAALVQAEKDRDSARRRVAELERTLAKEVNRNTDLETALERYRKAHVCTDTCKPNAHVAFTGSQLVRELETELADERERADKAEGRASQAERQRDNYAGNLDAQELAHAKERDEHRRSLAARDHLLSAATTRVRAAAEILGAATVTQARDEIVTTKGAVLADAIGNALRALEG